MLPLLFSCNIYSPLQGEGSAEDLIEEGMKCLHKRDYDCAIEKYNKLPDGEEKNKLLCLTNVTKAGASISTLATVAKNKNQAATPQRMLGEYAKSLLPWSEARQAGADGAKTGCLNAASGDFGILLKTLAYITHCATLMAKTDAVGGNNNGRLTKSDIDTMGDEDVRTCGGDIASVSSSEVSSAGMTDISAAISGIPAEILSEATAQIKSGLKDTLLE
ncbi:MAG: hypothetical protein HY537_08885 [Deltaproteobacteria bacterium]|nr:hypothetical protein [Deltaproteobacteria bacterium]